MAAQFQRAFHLVVPVFGRRTSVPTMPNGASRVCAASCGHPACAHGCTGYDPGVSANPRGWQEVDGVRLPPITWAEPAQAEDLPAVWSQASMG